MYQQQQNMIKNKKDSSVDDAQNLLIQKLKQNPDLLLKVVSSILQTFREAELLVKNGTDVEYGTLLLQRVQNQLFVVQQVIPDILKLQERHSINAHLDIIYERCRELLQKHIQTSALKHEEKPVTTSWWSSVQPSQYTTALAPWITDWNDSALQDPAVIQLLRTIALPLLFSESHRFDNIMLYGPSNCGKTYALHKIKEYISKREGNLPSTWTYYNTIQFPKEVESRLSCHDNFDYNSNDSVPYSILVADRIPIHLLVEWTKTDWWNTWLSYIHNHPKLSWIVVCSTQICLKDTVDKSLSNLFQTNIEMQYPSAITVYNVLKQRICDRFLNLQKLFQNTRLPILDEPGNLALISEEFSSTRTRGFADLLHCLDIAIQMCNGLAMQENVAYSFKENVWFTRNSIVPQMLPDEVKYALLQPMQTEYMICPQLVDQKESSQSTTWWNVQLNYKMASTELDRISQVYAAETESHDTLGVIAEIPLDVLQYPYFLRDGWDMCSELLVGIHFSICKHILTEIPHQKLLNKDYKSIANAQLSIHHLANLPTKVEKEWFVCSSSILLNTLQGGIQHGVTHPSMVLICNRTSKSQDAIQFQLRCGDNISSTLTHTMKAEQLRSELKKITQCEGDYHIIQLQIRTGYHYFIDYIGLDLPTLHVSSDIINGEVVLYPRIQMISGGVDLPEHYCLTTESDVDLLTEKYTSVYKDLFREDEQTWKGKPIRAPEHLAYLNDKYSKEVKFYLRMYSAAMQMKQNHYAGLLPYTKEALDNALYDLQNHLDYMLLLVPENDDTSTKEWNEIWSMSNNHHLYKQFHPPDNNDLNAIIENDVSFEWLKHGKSFSISPHYLILLQKVCNNYPNKKTETASSLIPFRAWKHIRHQTLDTQLASHVKLFIHAPSFQINQNSVWSSACAISHMLKDEKSIRRCLRNQDIMTIYLERTEYSLLHNILTDLNSFTAPSIGLKDESKNAIKWYSFYSQSKTSELNVILSVLKGNPDTWSLLADSAKDIDELQWLFALCATSVNETSTNNVQTLFSHLMMFRTWHNWLPDTLFPNNLPHCVQRILQRCIFMKDKQLQSKNVRTSNTLLSLCEVQKSNSFEKTEHTLSKNTLTSDQLTHVMVSGLRSHHLFDAIRHTVN